MPYHRWYHIHVQKTTVYLPDDLKAAVTRAAEAAGVSEAAVIREAIRSSTGGSVRPRPRGGLFSSGVGRLSESVEEALAGFGER